MLASNLDVLRNYWAEGDGVVYICGYYHKKLRHVQEYPRGFKELFND